MNQERRRAKELLELEIKLVRLRIAASYLKQQKPSSGSMIDHLPLFQFLDIGSDLAKSQMLYKTTSLPIKRKYRFVALLALFALQAVQSHFSNHK